MRLNGKLAGDLSQDDLMQLIEDRRPEDRYLDYKRDPYGKTDADKRELLKDVVGLANASGGVILIGIEEDKSSVAVALPGVDLDPDQKDPMERYERTIRDGIEPRLTGVVIQRLPVGESGKAVIAIGVPQSLNQPHRVSTVGSKRWTVRHNRDTIDMTYAEIRNAFIDGANILARVRGFHAERCNSVFPYGANNGTLLLHVISLAIDGGPLDVRAAMQYSSSLFPPGYVSNPCPLRPNLDGVRAQSPADQEHWRGWCQLYRDGKVEGVCVGYVTVSGDRRILDESQFRYDIFAAVPAYVNGLANLGFNPPYAVAISLLNADHSIISHQLNPKAYLDLHIASFEPVLIETASLTGSWHSALQSIFDQLWNGYGFSMCHPYP